MGQARAVDAVSSRVGVRLVASIVEANNVTYSRNLKLWILLLCAIGCKRGIGEGLCSVHDCHGEQLDGLGIKHRNVCGEIKPRNVNTMITG